VPSGQAAQPAAGFAPADARHVAAGAVTPGFPLIDLLARIEPSLHVPAGEAGGTGAAAAPDNVFYLPRFRQSLPKGSLPRGDERTLDLLSRVFETVLLDEHISPQVRELLRMLQLPVLKAALMDRRFFFEEAHPARRLVDLMSRMGWEQRPEAGADDALLQAMRRGVDRIAPDAGPDAFAAAVAELEAGIEAEDQAREAALAAPVAGALKAERLQAATRAARDAVALRLKDGDVVDVIGGFLEQRWTTVLTFAYSIEEDKPGAVGSATRAMDDLIWSTQPKPTPDQKKALIARLPRLLATLNKWLDAIHWQDAERLQFFARLAEYHAAIVRAPVELSPERQLELAVEAAQQDALRKAALEQAARDQAEARLRESEAQSPLDGLERGTWCEFASGGARRKVKLAWISPMRTLFIFSGAGREEAFSMPAERLVAALHSGAARVLAIDGVVGQVLSEAMGQGAVNDAAIAFPAAG
jgi:hypothetical protein